MRPLRLVVTPQLRKTSDWSFFVSLKNILLRKTRFCLQFDSWFINVEVQFYPWFKFSFLLFQTHYHVIIIHYHTQKQNKRKFEPRIKLNHNIYFQNVPAWCYSRPIKNRFIFRKRTRSSFPSYVSWLCARFLSSNGPLSFS